MKEDLLKIGLNQTEIDIYLTLLEYSRLTPANLGKITNINRSTVYAACFELIKKGLIEEDLSGKTKSYMALSPQRLKDYLGKRLREIRADELVIERIIPDLEQIPKSGNYSIPKVQVVYGADVEDFLYKKTQVWEKSMRDCGETTWWGFQDHTLVEQDIYRKWVLWYWKQAREDIDLRLFTNKSDIEEKMKDKNISRRQLKFWTGNSFTSTQWILGEYIVSVMTRDKNHYLVQIRDRVLADSMRNLAKNMWDKNDA